METTIQIAIDVILFLIASYFLFYRSFLKELGKQNAQLTSIEEKTKKIEGVKREFTQEIEGLKAELQKGNVTYQINLAELTKRRFDRIDTLYIDLINLQNFVKNNLFFFNDEADLTNKVNEFKKFYEIADESRHKCSLYISDPLKQKIIDVLNGAFSAYTSFRGLYNTDTRKLGEVSIFNLQKQELLIRLSGQNIQHLEKLEEQIDKFPELLNGLESEFKQQIILKDIK